ncbi:MAG: peptidoglycan-binding protein, partial [Acidobacteria bacterium]|nr:peptidoglycan-binding protein [Acidobacteriota bacterium]
MGAALLMGAAPISLFAQTKAKSKSAIQKPLGKSVTSAKGNQQGTSTAAKKSSAKGKKSKKQPPRKRGQTAPTPDRIREIQSALSQTGHYSGEPSGKWDASTIDAMKRFQDSQGFKPTGRVDAPTLQRLGLGSQVAGLAPPRVG